MIEKIVEPTQERNKQFTTINREAALKTEDLRQAAVPDYEARRETAREIEKKLADSTLSIPWRDRLSLNMFLLLLRINPSAVVSDEEESRADLTAVKQMVRKNLKVELATEQVEMQRVADEMGDYMDFVTDPLYPERLEAVLQKAEEEAEAVKREAQNICLQRVNVERSPKDSYEPFDEYAKRRKGIMPEIASGKLQPTADDYQRAFERVQEMNEFAVRLAKGFISFDLNPQSSGIPKVGPSSPPNLSSPLSGPK